jgi:outer membrane murein-binding lipoprotein Lpp
MKKTNRFALLAVLAAVIGSTVIAGCGGGEAEDDATNTTNATGAGDAAGDE